MPEPHVIIPARLASTRFPRKVLADVGGKPMIQRVWMAAVEAVGTDRAHIATDSEEVADVARGFGADVQMTSAEATCGTERVAEISERIDASALVNVQGDDPFIPASLISDAIEAFFDRGLAVCTPIFRMSVEEGQTPHIVKATRSSSGRALYFSRSVIPHDRDGTDDGDQLWGHVGLYVYSPEAVKEHKSFGESELERREKLEQLRFLENDIPIATFVTEYRPRAIDVSEDLEALIAEGKLMTDSLVARARAVLETERQALDTALDRAPEQVAAAARLILDREPADVIVTGVGKSGHIAHKLAATFSSVGTRSHFYWTSEMFHGDLGSVDQAGVVIVVSKSGSGADIAQLVDFCHHRGIGLIGIIADTHSPIVSKLDVLIDASIHQEADPEGFVPTTSTTLALALGDALAVCLMEARGFTSTDFAKFHPNGALGARLNRTVAEIMAGPDDIPRLQPDHSVRDLAIEMSRHPTGLAVVHGDDEALLGVVSDGDLRRALTEVSDLSDTQVREVMTTDPSTIEPDALLAHALAVMEGHQPGAISALPVVSAGKVLGVVTIHQLHREIPS